MTNLHRLIQLPALQMSAVALALASLSAGCAGSQGWVSEAPEGAGHRTEPIGELYDPQNELAENRQVKDMRVITLGQSAVPDAEPEPGQAAAQNHIHIHQSQSQSQAPYGYGLGYGYYGGYGGYWGGGGGSVEQAIAPPQPPPSSGGTPPMGGNYGAPPSYGPAFPFQSSPGNVWKPSR